jgi:flagellar hook-associated protein 2
MATGAVSSLGLGSGILTASVIDQLKANDTSLIITPITNKITANTQKQASMSMLTSLATTFTDSASSLEDSSLYQNRTVSGTNTAVSVTADKGASIQDFTISNTKLATTSVSQSGSFTSSSAMAATGSGKLNINVNGTDYTISYDGTTTYDDLKTKINDAAGANVTANILQTGDNKYSLVLNSKTTGVNQQVTMTDLSGKLNSTLVSDGVKSGTFALSSSKIATGSGKIDLNIGGTKLTSFDYTATTSLSDLVSMINNDATASASVVARAIKNDAGTYNLVLTAKSGSEDKTITLSDENSGLNTALTSGATALSGSMTSIQAASDATFKYNGISMTRSTNSITDVSVGLTINLLTTDATSTANITVTQDTQPVQDAMKSFVDNYNAMHKQLVTMTIGDTATNTKALFTGDSTLNGVDRDIKNLINSNDRELGLSLTDYGISVNRDGTLAFDSNAFTTKMEDDPSAMADYFSGVTTVDSYGNTTSTDGIFTSIYDSMNNLTKGNGVLANLTTGLNTEAKNLTTQKTNATDLLTARYNTMTQQFIAYDAMIAKLNSQFSSLSQQISMAINGN